MSAETSIWEKLRSVAMLLASVIVPLAVVVVTQIYTHGEAERTREARYVELAIEILREKPDEESQAMSDYDNADDSTLFAIGDVAPDFTLPDVMTDEWYSLHDLRGRKTLLYVWSSW